MALDSIANNKLSTSTPAAIDALIINSTRPVEAAVEFQKHKEFKLHQMNEKQKRKQAETKNIEKKTQVSNLRKKKVEPLLEIEGNQRLNKVNKMHFKKLKKEHNEKRQN